MAETTNTAGKDTAEVGHAACEEEAPYTGMFCERLRMAMRVSAINATNLSQISGLEQSVISHFTRGERLPSLQSLARLLRALPAVDARWLVTGVEK